MTRVLIYIGETLLDLFAKSILAVTYQNFDVRDLKVRGVSFSSTIDLPPTANNLQALGNVTDVNSNSFIPYSQITSKCVIGGIEFFNGRFIISNTENGTIKANIYNAVIDIFDQIKGKKLYELGYLTDGVWDSATMIGSVNNTSGVMAPIIDWGGNSVVVTSSINFRLLPCYSYKDVVLAILNSSGYTFSGDVLDNNSDFDDLVLPWSHDAMEYVPEYETDHFFEATQSTPQIYTPPAGNSSQDISLDVADPDGVYFNTSTGKYELPNVSANDEIGRLNFDLFIDFTVVASVLDPAGMNFRISILEDTSAGPDTAILLTSNIFITSSPFRIVRSLSLEDVAALSDTKYNVQLLAQDGTGTITSVTVNNIKFSGGLTTTANTNWLFHNYLLPDLTQEDVLKDFFVRYGALLSLDIDGVNISALSMKQIIRNKSAAKDWTNKRVGGEENITLSNSIYAQNNYFKYEDGEGVREGLGSGNLLFINENIEESSDYFTSSFENCVTKVPTVLVDTPINCAYIPIYDGTAATFDDIVDSPGIKLLTIRDKKTDEPALFAGGAVTAYKVAYFIDESLEKDTSFEYFLEQWYTELQLAFNRTKFVQRSYVLTAEDVYQAPYIIYDTDSFYLVNKIPKFISGKTDKVELLRVL